MSIVTNGYQGPAVELTVAAQASVDAETVLANSALDAGFFHRVGYTLTNGGANSVNVTVYRANKSDFSDEVIDGSAIAVGSGASKVYADANSAFRYYRLKIAATTPGAQGSISAQALAK